MEAHKRGMKVILDGVFNHCGSFNKWLDRERIYEAGKGYEPGAYVAQDSPYHTFLSFIMSITGRTMSFMTAGGAMIRCRS